MAIEIVKFDAMYARSDAELDYCFTLAKNLGARAISCEIDVAGTKRVGQFADKHRLMVGYHGHAATGPESLEGSVHATRRTTAPTSTSATSSPAATARRFRSSRSITRASRTCT